MSKNKVTVVADDNGNVIRQSQNPEIGYVRVTQEAVNYSATGWVQRKTRSALILGNLEDLAELKFKNKQKLDGKIVVKESTEPFNQTDPDRDLKVAGSTGIICCTADGEPIYRTTFYDMTGEQPDAFVAHANGDAIRQANSEGVGAEAIAKDEFKAEDVENSTEEDSFSMEEEVQEEPEETTNEVEVDEESFEL
tara:strand:- start:923 stop:1504 length:582 start_codon:yes stop_codon:yes gene_type:complete